MSQSDSLNGYMTNSTQKMFSETDSAASLGLASRNISLGKSTAEHAGLQNMENGAVDETISDDPELVNEVSPEDGERGQVLQTTQVVMNMLDVTMPNILTEEKKKKVLAAVGQGDTIMQALLDAVPEDVREKLTAAVSGILHAQGPNLKFDQLLGVARISDISSGLNAKIQDEGILCSEGVNEDSFDLLKTSDDLPGSSADSQPVYLSRELEQVANAVSFSVGRAYDPRLEVEYHSIGSDKVGTLHGEHVIKAISSAVQETSFLRRVVPVGVIVGSSLAALRKYFGVATVRDSGHIEPPISRQAKKTGENERAKVRGTEINHMPVDKSDHSTRLDNSVDRKEEEMESKNINNSVTAGAVTLPLGPLLHWRSTRQI